MTISEPMVVQMFIIMIESRATLGPANQGVTLSIPIDPSSMSKMPLGLLSQGGCGVPNPSLRSPKLIRPFCWYSQMKITEITTDELIDGK